jgi:hypothetical protein
MLDSMLQKKSSGVDPHYLDIWLPAHDCDVDAAEKLVSNNFKCYAAFIIFPYLLNILQERYTEVSKKIHGLELEDPRSVPFNVDATYVVGGGSLHRRYVKILFSLTIVSS